MQRKFVAKNNYFLAAGLSAFFGVATFGAAFLFGAAGAGTTGAAFSAVLCSRRALISALSLSLRSVSFAMLALSFAIALAVFETGAFFTAALTTGDNASIHRTRSGAGRTLAGTG